jgi:outer membrane protein assembly factor BamB
VRDTRAGGADVLSSDLRDALALNAATSKTLWRYNTGGAEYSPPVVADGMLYAGSYNETLYAFDLR